jgi:hypothetical protein
MNKSITLTPAEGIRFMSYCLQKSGIYSDYPMSDEQRESWRLHFENEQAKKEKDPSYREEPWYRDGVGPKPRTRKEMAEDQTYFIANMLAERPKDFDLIKEVKQFDIKENFMKECEKLKRKNIED